MALLMTTMMTTDDDEHWCRIRFMYLIGND